MNKQATNNTGIFSSQLQALISSGSLGGWQNFFQTETSKEYFLELEAFLNDEYANNRIFPSVLDIFNAFTAADLFDISVVIIGQDPYHEENQAMGLAFSVPKDCKIPPSLRNIFKELYSDLGISRDSGDISDLAAKGVLLINTVLTVRKGEANSHAKRGWEKFTSAAISYLCNARENVLFLLFGKPSEKFEKIITENQHILKTSHPSPLSAYRGFLGSEIFSKSNAILNKFGKNIDWQQPKDNG